LKNLLIPSELPHLELTDMLLAAVIAFPAFFAEGKTPLEIEFVLCAS